MSATTQPKNAEAKARPALSVRAGTVRIPIWKNEGEDGPYYKAGQPELSYKGSDGRWYPGKSYGPRDLVNLIKAAALAHTELVQRYRSESTTAKEAAEPEAGE